MSPIGWLRVFRNLFWDDERLADPNSTVRELRHFVWVVNPDACLDPFSPASCALLPEKWTSARERSDKHRLASHAKTCNQNDNGWRTFGTYMAWINRIIWKNLEREKKRERERDKKRERNIERELKRERERGREKEREREREIFIVSSLTYDILLSLKTF